MAHALDAQEYKLLLAPGTLEGESAKKQAKHLWKTLKGVIDGLDRPHEGDFTHKERRRVCFYDRVPLLLDRQGFACRESFALDDDGQETAREVTLKLREPERTLVEDVDLSGAEGDARTKLEEDIGPILVRPAGDPEGPFAPKEAPATRVLFALSTTQAAPIGGAIEVVQDVVDLYPRILDALRANRGDRLRRGPEIGEVVLKGAAVDLGSVKGEFAFTLWRFAGRSAIAEISFRCRARDGAVPAKEAGRAQALFIAMQTRLRGLIFPGGTSKTALALPS